MSASDRRLGDLIAEINENKLIIRPPFQRRLVWTNKDKEYFIDTVLRNLPFPEIFICTGERESGTTGRKMWLVDGQQRITTLRDYIAGSKDILCKTVPRFADLDPEVQESFVETTVAVRDLKRLTKDQLNEIFTRINSTNYMLKAMEVRHALFSGAYKEYCDSLSSQPFFSSRKVFPDGRKKRMEDLAFCVILVTTILGGYYQRDSKNEEYLERYNEEFPQQEKMQVDLDRVFAFLDECEFEDKSPVWKLTNLFTVIVELHNALIIRDLLLDPKTVGTQLEGFLLRVSSLSSKDTQASELDDDDVLRYWKASRTAANDKHSRVQRAEIISKLFTESAKQPQTSSPTHGKKSTKNKKSAKS